MSGPSLDFQTHLAALEANGLLVRVDRPINKDTELHPLVRCQFIGGIPEEERRAFLFTNVVDSHGRHYDIPVAVGALAASAKIYALGMGRRVDEIGAAWTQAIANPIPPVVVNSPRCQEVVITGDDLRRADGGLARAACPHLHSGLRFRALSHGNSVRHARSGNGSAQYGHLSRRVEKNRPARRADVFPNWRRRRLPALAEVSGAPRTHALRHRRWLCASGSFYGSSKAAGRPGRDGRGRSARRRAHSDGEMRERRSGGPGRFRNRDRRPDRYRSAGARGAFRREPRLRGPRGLQHVHAGDSDHAQAFSRFRLHHQPGDAKRIEHDQESGLRADVPGALAREPLDPERSPRGDA